jgi:hypothetical protein
MQGEHDFVLGPNLTEGKLQGKFDRIRPDPPALAAMRNKIYSVGAMLPKQLTTFPFPESDGKNCFNYISAKNLTPLNAENALGRPIEFGNFEMRVCIDDTIEGGIEKGLKPRFRAS